MTEFLIKSSITMAVLLGLYHVLFEREKMHRFNRFYLLSALVFSLALPFVTVITYIIEIEASVATPLQTSGTVTVVSQQPIDYLPYISWGLYGIVTLLLIARFIKNVSHFTKKAAGNSKIAMGSAKLVLVEQKTLPHTFLNYIFLNREEYEAKKIEDELYTHEYTHVKQWHTLDILFIEALKTIFWFNPLLYLYKKAIQLNHEFLADEKVIDATANTIYYQSLLLEKATVGTTFSIASNLTFSLTKKRFLMMTKTTSTTKAGILKLTILPVVTGLMILLCTETVAQHTKPKTDAATQARIDKMVVPDRVVDSLKAANPDAFSEDLNIRYKNTKFTFQHKDGTVTEVTGYKNLNEKQKKVVANGPITFGMDLTMEDDEQTTAIPTPAKAKEDREDPYVKYKKTKFRFTDKNGNVAEKIGYRTLTEEDKKKIAAVLPAIGDNDLVEYKETETGVNLHQGPSVKTTTSSTTPEYPGGMNALMSSILKKFNLPKVDKDLMVKIYVSFIVEEDGSVSNVKILRDPGYGLGNEAKRVLEEDKTKWIPAQQNGIPARASFNLPITVNIKV
ncbi:M56 family metallopeptidase [Flavobacterium sp. DG1-102-2]|uniref:M56 family metallopeptidase n=1 Tax=Flavobacterium sp. DG1-102-2 TaxID=3081663 RepID=UPI002948E0DB|nr:M56 family metallopeptidase [Flavobacterium sp. DG1-102-2]MDV6169347.1 M56 family metallopeptidase [Flavobacterium sp. DG1-102-2]